MVHFEYIDLVFFDMFGRGGEIGIHADLRGLWEKSRRGSSPLLGTSLCLRLRLAGQFFNRFSK